MTYGKAEALRRFQDLFARMPTLTKEELQQGLEGYALLYDLGWPFEQVSLEMCRYAVEGLMLPYHGYPSILDYNVAIATAKLEREC